MGPVGGKLSTRPSTTLNSRKKRASRSRTPVRRPVEAPIVSPHWLFQTPPVAPRPTTKQTKSIVGRYKDVDLKPAPSSVGSVSPRASTSSTSPEAAILRQSTDSLSSASSSMIAQETKAVSFFEPKSWARELRTSFLTSESLVNVNGTLESRRIGGASTVNLRAGIDGESLKSQN